MVRKRRPLCNGGSGSCGELDSSREWWSRTQTGCGFTTIELLVIVAIIGLLVALLLPAVQGAREAMRRAECAANLKQIGVAMNGYYAVHNMFPPGHMSKRPPIVDNYSEITFLLPQLEQQPLYSSINFAFDEVETPETPTIENHTARNTILSVLLCPSDGEPRHLNSYRFNKGRWGMIEVGYFDGPFTFYVLPSQATVTDGLSNTAFVSERIAGSFSSVTGWPRGVKYPPTTVGGPTSSDGAFIPFCLAAEPALWSDVSGRYWMFGGFYNTDYNHNGSPNDPRPSCGAAIGNTGFGLHPPRSYHPGVVNVMMGDGRVEAISNSIAQQIWVALGTRSAGDF
jgi:prepilin-type processing-associated H-X9-DG protein